MTSFILGKIDFDEAKLAREVAVIRGMEKNKEIYDEFTSGFWKNISLLNATGDGKDGVLRDAASSPKPTEYAAQVPYISEVISSRFSGKNLSMVRARDIVDAAMMPHKDFLELEGDVQKNFRVLMVLEDNESTFNSDEEKVFRMRKGEIWFLDAAGLHCAANFSNESRVSLCLDFVFDGDFTPADIFADRGDFTSGVEPLIVKRKALPDRFAVDLRRLSVALNRHNFRDVAFTLAKLHFTYEAPIGECYDWLIEIAERTDDPAIVAKAENAKEFFAVDRSMHERFSFTAW